MLLHCVTPKIKPNLPVFSGVSGLFFSIRFLGLDLMFLAIDDVLMAAIRYKMDVFRALYQSIY